MKLTSIASSSEGNSIFVGTDKTKLLVDCGISAKRIESALKELDLTVPDFDGILITHEHSDHIKGLGVISRRYGIPVFATSKTIDAIFEYKNLGKVEKDLFHSIDADRPFLIGDITVEASRVWHDAADPVCYSFCSDGVKASIATDLGDYDEYLVEKIYGSDILFVEANHDVNMLQVGRYPYYLKRRILGRHGHLSNERCAQLIEDTATSDTRKVYLGHLSKENNYEKLAYETVKVSLHNMEGLPLEVAKRDAVSTVTSV
ncbi:MULTISPECIES: MBL fold metallo-hydrolase [Anaerostipes]|uniref:MBL fold metallo-hydrolase n=1 Tax=Anaerostipes TaxID=207244 RepID=UPI000951F726|nr:MULTISPECIES: MBL fold metallo-hydrolase [Anaerostipes]MCI5622613.1 MBL fold metallo-hydrolase [Anaerostipes sp.]OLR58307.1 ribonuclease Z [Anaerostipes sp. 494a]